jgi:DMSO/TMAO reductase YedYZ molybdopterin-dependent catalytic subunit
MKRLALVTAASAVFLSMSAAFANAEPPRTEVAPGAVAVTGDVRAPRTLTTDDIRALPTQSRSVTFETQAGRQSHTYDGATLSDVVSPALPNVDDAAKHPFLPVAILAVGADGYSASVAWAELSPELTANPVLVAYTEDGQPLDRPRLVVPGDVEGARYVSDLVELRVENLARS